MDRIRRLATVAALTLALILAAIAPATATNDSQPAALDNVRAAALSKPAGCPGVFDRAAWHRVARATFDGKWRATAVEKRKLAHRFRCQANPKSKPILREHRKRYSRSHTYRLWHQGIGKLNRVFPAHGLHQAGGFVRFGAVRRVFEAAQATPREAYQFATIVRGESGGGRMGGFPGILGIDGWVVPGATSVGIGLAQTTPAVWCCVAIERLRQLGGETALRNPLVNAVMSYFLYQAAGNSFAPWYGTRFFHDPGSAIRSALTAADRRWLKLGGMLRLRTR